MLNVLFCCSIYVGVLRHALSTATKPPTALGNPVMNHLSCFLRLIDVSFILDFESVVTLYIIQLCTIYSLPFRIEQHANEVLCVAFYRSV